MRASNAAPTTSNQVAVTSRASSDWTVTKNVVPAGVPPQVDTPYTYRVGITLAAGGNQNLNGVTFVDTLPAARCSSPRQEVGPSTRPTTR